jgi:hypothetical protein
VRVFALSLHAAEESNQKEKLMTNFVVMVIFSIIIAFVVSGTTEE